MSKQKSLTAEDEEFDLLKPDRTRLDEEWVNQPKMVFDYIIQLEEAREALDEANSELKTVHAECDKDIRANPESYDLPTKTTETMIKNTIMLQPEYKAAEKEFLNIKHEVGIIGAAVSAMEHRKKALENLVYLYGQNYFSTPRASDEDTKAVVDEMEQRRAKERRQRGQKGKKRKRRGDKDVE